MKKEEMQNELEAATERVRVLQRVVDSRNKEIVSLTKQVNDAWSIIAVKDDAACIERRVFTAFKDVVIETMRKIVSR